MSPKDLIELNQYLEAAELALQHARGILGSDNGEKVYDKMLKSRARGLALIEDSEGEEKIIEGVFNGQEMVAADGKEYAVPANYASKSKLVAGDILKLTIEPNGNFIYKQIKPVERERVRGKILIDEEHEQYAILTAEGKKYNVLTASVTYFKGEPGDEAIILVPKDKAAKWAALENVIKEKNEELAEIELKEALQTPAVEDIKVSAVENLQTPVEEKSASSADKKEIEKIINAPDDLEQTEKDDLAEI